MCLSGAALHVKWQTRMPRTHTHTLMHAHTYTRILAWAEMTGPADGENVNCHF